MDNHKDNHDHNHEHTHQHEHEHEHGAAESGGLWAGMLAGLLIGGLAGAIAMLLLAPQSGKRTRAKLRRRSFALRAQTAETMEDMEDSMEDAMADARDKTHKMTHDARKQAEKLDSAATPSSTAKPREGILCAYECSSPTTSQVPAAACMPCSQRCVGALLAIPSSQDLLAAS